MIFGPKFYPTLNKLTNWRQSLFALVLATRSYANYALYTEVAQSQGRSEYKKVLAQCWQYHLDKFNHIDLSETFNIFAPYIPTEEDCEKSEGARFAFDASIMLNAVIDAIVFNSNAAEVSSKASMASVVRYCDLTMEEELDDDELTELEIVEQEINVQVELMEMLKAPRSNELINKLLDYALSFESSNIGLELETKLTRSDLGIS